MISALPEFVLWLQLFFMLKFELHYFWQVFPDVIAFAIKIETETTCEWTIVDEKNDNNLIGF